MGYKPFGFDALENQNAASTQVANNQPTMPGYTGLDKQTFDQMRTPEDQIHWLYQLCLTFAKTKADLEYVDAEFAKIWEHFNEFKEHGFDDYYAEQINKWIQDNANAIITKMLGIGVFFGLTSDGYFCAYVPQTWGDVVFDTGAVYGRSDYGCLLLRYNVDAPGVIDNTYRYQLPGVSQDAWDKLVADVELIGRTLWTHMDTPVEGGQ